MNKKLHIFYINKIKTCLLRIFEAEDDEFPNRKIVSANEKAIDKYLNQAGIFDEKLRKELLENISWTNDNCKERLEKLGWEVVIGKDNINKIEVSNEKEN